MEKTKRVELCCKEVKKLCDWHFSAVTLKEGKMEEFKELCKKHDVELSHIQRVMFEKIEIDEQNQPI